MDADDDNRAVATRLSISERETALREAMDREEPNLRRGIEALVYKKGLATSRPNAVEIASEVLQEALMRALERAGTYDPSRPAHAWLYKFAFNVVRERLRANRNAYGRTLQNALTQPAEEMTPSKVALEYLHDAESTDPYRIIELLDLVPQPAREVLRLRYVENLRGPNLAAALGTTEGAARVRVARAKAQLIDAYGESEGWQKDTEEGW